MIIRSYDYDGGHISTALHRFEVQIKVFENINWFLSDPDPKSLFGKDYDREIDDRDGDFFHSLKNTFG